MEYGKYITVLERGIIVAIVFDSLIEHSTFLKCYHKDNVVSAGFFRMDDEDIITYGKSTSLDKSPNDEDGKIIKILLGL